MPPAEGSLPRQSKDATQVSVEVADIPSAAESIPYEQLYIRGIKRELDEGNCPLGWLAQENREGTTLAMVPWEMGG